MKNNCFKILFRIFTVLFLSAGGVLLSLGVLVKAAPPGPSAGAFAPGNGPDTLMAAAIAFTSTDQTPTTPLTHPVAAAFAPRYVSGFGIDNAFTVFFEDRDNGSRIYFNTTTTGPLGFSATSTPTNILQETHFLVKDWPVTVGDTLYAYRGWGSVGNNPQHHFYVSNNLITWTLVSTFTISNSAAFTNARGQVYYGFHDVINLNGTYYAFAESNAGQTMLVSSTLGTDNWIAFAGMGGLLPADGPLQMPGPTGPTPTGSFFELAENRGYGKIHVPGNDSAIYLAVNTTAKPGMDPAALEGAFTNPANWTWHDGTTGLPSSPVLTETAEHDFREAWLVPRTGPDGNWVIIYTADFGASDGGKALGYAGSPPAMINPAGSYIYLPLISREWN